MNVHKSWQEIINLSLNSLDGKYLDFLYKNEDYFPDFDNFLNAFKTLPREKTKAILFGQDPYPRKKSAIGYAFIDGMVEEIFGQNGFCKEVNKAVSLRNFLKMQLRSQGFLQQNTNQNAIAKIPKQKLISSIMDLKNNFEKEGILLLNRALVFTSKEQTKLHVKAFKPLMETFLRQICKDRIDLILFGNEAKSIEKLLPKNHNFKLFKTQHPYNISFITDEKNLKYFSKLNLMGKDTFC
ncbi:MAG: uracil-DNA glycosylase [Proteobacteria bacterium]|nr:MAG: uracil-DNA glycosylase [Pseudomonadota bacterium]